MNRARRPSRTRARLATLLVALSLGSAGVLASAPSATAMAAADQCASWSSGDYRYVRCTFDGDDNRLYVFGPGNYWHVYYW